MEHLCLGKAIVLDKDAEVVYGLFGWHFFLKSLLEFGMQFLILIGEVVDLLQRVEATNGRYELFPRDLSIIIEVNEINPLLYLIWSLIRQQFSQSLL